MVYKIVRGVNPNGVEFPIRTSLTGYTLVKQVQSTVQMSDEAEYVFVNSAPQFTGIVNSFDLPSGDISNKYFVTVYNPSSVTALNMNVLNAVSIGGGNKYAAVYDKSNTAGAIVVPAATYTGFSATAWNSCFTDIATVLTDESTDLNDANGPDVPFNFGAVNDAIYFGASTTFDRIRINTGTAGVYNATFVWEYWDGDSWEALTDVVDTTNATVQDGSQPFKRTGTYSISFYPPHDWATVDPAGNPVSNYWIRARVATYTSKTTPFSLQQGFYKRIGVADVHNFLIEGVYGGDECKITLENATALSATDGFSAWVRIKRL